MAGEKTMNTKSLGSAYSAAILALVGMLMTFSAMAGANDSGFRTGLDLSISSSSATGPSSPLTSSFGYGIGGHIGYDINSYVAIAASLSATTGPKANDIGVSTRAFTVNVIGLLPIKEGISLYADVGAGRLSTTASLSGISATRSKNGVTLGAGVEFGSHTQQSGLRLGVETYDTGYVRTTKLLVGPVWKF